jgi:hypothetical protein
MSLERPGTTIGWLTGNWPARRVDHHHVMVIDMSEAQVLAVDRMQQVLAGTQAPEFRQGKTATR